MRPDVEQTRVSSSEIGALVCTPTSTVSTVHGWELATPCVGKPSGSYSHSSLPAECDGISSQISIK